MAFRTVCTAAVVTIGFGAAATAAVMFHSADTSQLLLFVVFAAWTLLPYAILYGAVRWLVSGVVTATTTLVVSLAVTGFGTACYYDAFFVNLGAQSGLIFLFVPLYQLLAATLVSAALGVVRAVSLPGRNNRNT